MEKNSKDNLLNDIDDFEDFRLGDLHDMDEEMQEQDKVHGLKKVRELKSQLKNDQQN